MELPWVSNHFVLSLRTFSFIEWKDGATGKKRRVTPILYSGGMEGKEARHATPRGFSEAIAQMYARV